MTTEKITEDTGRERVAAYLRGVYDDYKAAEAVYWQVSDCEESVRGECEVFLEAVSDALGAEESERLRVRVEATLEAVEVRNCEAFHSLELEERRVGAAVDMVGAFLGKPVELRLFPVDSCAFHAVRENVESAFEALGVAIA